MKVIRKKRIILTPGEVVRELRMKKGWSQEKLSKIVGIAVSNLSNIERNYSRLGEERAIILAEGLGVSPHFILFPNGFERENLKPKLHKIRENLSKIKREEAA